MFNLYADAIDQNGFMGLVSKADQKDSDALINDNRKIVASFALASIAILSVIADTAVLQLHDMDFARTAEVISNYSIV